MPDGLTTLLRRLDRTAAATVSFDETSLWQEGELNRLIATKLLVPCEPANQLLCDECGEMDDVALVESVLTPPFAAFLRCSLAGCYQVPVERLQRWQMSAAQVLEVIAQAIEELHELHRVHLRRTTNKSHWRSRSCFDRVQATVGSVRVTK